MKKEQLKYFPQTKDELESLIQQRIKDEGNEVDLNDIDVSAITDMSGLFSWMDFNGDISKWDVSKVTDMSCMFYRCEYFNQDISDWDVSKVTDMNGMFWDCKSFNQDISNWDVSNLNHLSYILSMFDGCAIKEEYKPKFK